MRHTQTTTKTGHNYRMLMVLASMLAMLASMLVMGQAARPAHASTNFTVTNTNDSGAGSLRQAILDANNTFGADVIDFDIPGTGVQTIAPSTDLPPITHQVTIDGYTQTGAHPNTKTVGDDAVLKIELNGSGLSGGTKVLEISNSSGSVIRGLAIAFAEGQAINVTGESIGNRIEGNFIGVRPSGTQSAGSQTEGLFISDGASETVVGGSTPGKRNVISSNIDGGVAVTNANGSRIKGNYIGTDKNGTSGLVGQGRGVSIEDASGTVVGGTTAASRNVISGNGGPGFGSGLAINNAQGTRVLGNRIGTTASGTGALGNGSNGLIIFGSSSGTLVGDGTSAGSNIIAFNGHNGVKVFDSPSSGNEISRNSIFSNGGLGIDLVGPGEDGSGLGLPTSNDAGDGDSGPNNLQNKPVFSSARNASGKTTIKGKLNSTSGKTYTIEFFSNPNGTNEGKKFIGQKSVTTDGSGNATFTFSPASKVALGQTVTATATKSATGETSEFSAAKTVTNS
jgi:hypothetical protein